MQNLFFEFIHKHGIYDEKVFKYYLDNAYTFDYYNEEFLIPAIGCTLIIKNKILKEITPIIPNEVDEITSLINVHEYVHTLCLYSRLNKRWKKEAYDEVLPIFYEKLFIKEYGNTNLENYGNILDNAAIKDGNKEYITSIKVCDELLSNYKHDGIDCISKKAKKLYKKNY